MTLKFEWDSEKALRNLKKHGISFHEAATIFGDPLADTFHDPDHSTEETRFITIGVSGRNKVLIVSHTDRLGRVRIISARHATRHERRFYEEEK